MPLPYSTPDSRERAGTRLRLLGLLRQRARTVDELATALGVTDNAVRAHLGSLERDRLVRTAGSRRPDGAGKPAILYEVPPDADRHFSRAYAPMLATLIATLASRLEPDSLADLLVSTGRQLAAQFPSAAGDRAARLDAAVAAMEAMGGQVDLEESGGRVVLQGAGCPLGDAVARHHDVCLTLQSFLEELLGERLERRCTYDDRPRCCFATEE